jgi:hypothetical protein
MLAEELLLGRRASGKKGVESRVSGIKNVLTDSRRLLYKKAQHIHGWALRFVANASKMHPKNVYIITGCN